MRIESQRTFLIVLGLIAAAIWVRGFLVKPVRVGRAAAATLATAAISRPPIVVDIDTSSQEAASAPEVSSHADWKVSPFLTDREVVENVAATRAGYILNGVLWDPQAPSAIINNQLVSVGDQLDQWQVIQIREKEVDLSDGTTTKTLTVE